MNDTIPPAFVDKGLKLAKDARLFGVSFFDMTHDELIAAAAQGWNAERLAREEMSERTENLLNLLRRHA